MDDFKVQDAANKKSEFEEHLKSDSHSSENSQKGIEIAHSPNFMIYVLLAIVIILLAANLFKGPAAVQVMNQEATDMSKPRGSDRGKEEDPYVSNQVKNTIVKNYVAIRDCYNAFIEKKPAVTDGKVMIDWTILENGKVKKAELVSSEIPDESLSRCMIEKIEAIEFPKPPFGEKYIAHKFFLKKDNGESVSK